MTLATAVPLLVQPRRLAVLRGNCRYFRDFRFMATDRADLSVNGWNSDYIEGLYRQWTSDPQSVDAQWRQFFSGFDLGTLRAAWTL